jgi:hypothetical protein
MITQFAFFVLILFLAEHTMKGASHIYDADVHYFPLLMYKQSSAKKDEKKH